MLYNSSSLWLEAGCCHRLCWTPSSAAFRVLPHQNRRRDGAQDSQKFASSASIASEAISAIRTVSSLGIEQSVMGHYVAELDQAIMNSTNPVYFIMLPFAFTQSVEYSSQALGFW